MEIGKSLKDSMLIAGAVSLDLVKQIRFRRAGGIFSSSQTIAAPSEMVSVTLGLQKNQILFF